MAPTPSPIPAHAPNPPLGKYLHRLRRQGLGLSRHPPRQPLPPRTEQPKAYILDAALQSSVAPEGPPPPPIAPTPSGSLVLAPEPSAIPVGSNQPQGQNPLVDISGNIVAAVVVVILVLGGLVGLVIGGEILRRQAKTTRRVSPPHSRSSGRRKSELIKNAAGSPQQRTHISHERFPYDEKTLAPLTRPPPALSRERQRRLSDVWPIRKLSRALSNRRSCPEEIVPLSPPRVNLPTTWSEFSPVSFYVAPPRTILSSIPEELEDCQSQTDSDIAATLGVTIQRSVESGPMVPTSHTNQPKSSHSVLLDGFDGTVATEQCDPQDCWNEAGSSDEDAKSLGSPAPDMTSDEGGSSGTSMTSLESLEDGNDHESLREEVFELRRAQTRSMQMNKGVLLSLSLKDLDDGEMDGGCDSSRNPDAEGCHVEREQCLAMLGDLDEFPSPPSILPMIPSFVSGF